MEFCLCLDKSLVINENIIKYSNTTHSTQQSSSIKNLEIVFASDKHFFGEYKTKLLDYAKTHSLLNNNYISLEMKKHILNDSLTMGIEMSMFSYDILNIMINKINNTALKKNEKYTDFYVGFDDLEQENNIYSDIKNKEKSFSNFGIFYDEHHEKQDTLTEIVRDKLILFKIIYLEISTLLSKIPTFVFYNRSIMWVYDEIAKTVNAFTNKKIFSENDLLLWENSKFTYSLVDNELLFKQRNVSYPDIFYTLTHNDTGYVVYDTQEAYVLDNIINRYLAYLQKKTHDYSFITHKNFVLDIQKSFVVDDTHHASFSMGFYTRYLWGFGERNHKLMLEAGKYHTWPNDQVSHSNIFISYARKTTVKETRTSTDTSL